MRNQTVYMLLLAVSSFAVWAVPPAPSKSGTFTDSTVTSTALATKGGFVAENVSVARLSRLPPCEVQTSDISDKPTSAEIAALLSRYSMACNQELAVALESIYVDEKRDPQWATPLEEQIRLAAKKVPGLKIEGDCRKNLCRFDFYLSGPEKGPLHGLFDQPLIASLSETRLAISTVDVATSHGYVKYFCSVVAPASFVDLLKRKMDNASGTLQ